VARMYRAHGCELDWRIGPTASAGRRGTRPFEHLERLSGVRIERAYVRAQRSARMRELNLTQSVLPGVRDYLREARELRLKVGLASSSDRAWVHGHLGRLGLLDISTPSSASRTPARTSPIRHRTSRSRHARGPAAGAVAFEDSPHGVAAAKAAGMLCVRCPTRSRDGWVWTARTLCWIRWPLYRCRRCWRDSMGRGCRTGEHSESGGSHRPG